MLALGATPFPPLSLLKIAKVRGDVVLYFPVISVGGELEVWIWKNRKLEIGKFIDVPHGRSLNTLSLRYGNAIKKAQFCNLKISPGLN